MTKGTRLRALLACGSAAMLGLPMAAAAQTTQDTTPPAATPTGAALPESAADGGDAAGARGDGEIIVTGSRIRRDPNDSALPLQIVTTAELERNAITSPEQLLSFLSTSGTGPDNLASNADVVTGAQRGTNGLSGANLRGQGSASTLVLLNNRRVAAHGLSGSAVDVNQIPFAAIERVEVLKDGASAIYGTDAIGGVINFITRTDFTGVNLQGFTDVTEQGDGNIYRVSGLVGFGDLARDGWNVMGSVSYRWNQILRGQDRDFVNGFQPDRGLSIDTRGTPFATIFPINATTTGANYAPTGTLFGGTATAQLLPGLVFPGTTQRADGGVNLLDIPGGAGCTTMDGGLPYDEALWSAPGARWACSWDTGRAAVIQQPIETLTYFGRAVARAGEHEFSVEVTGSDATSAKSFSNAQVSANNTTTQAFYPLNDRTRDTYNYVYNTLLPLLPAIAGNYGKPIGLRWRCLECGPREYVTESKTFRVAGGADGPLWTGWDYRVGASYAQSETESTLGSGYYYRDTVNGNLGLVDLISQGYLNPFLRPGESQTPEALQRLAAASAEGTILYGGKYTLKQFDASIAGPLFSLPGGKVQAAVGVDYRREEYEFNGDAREAAARPVIFLAAFDDANALAPVSRDVKAAYAEVLFPLFKGFEITGAVRIDDYTGFGNTVNPKISAKWRPWEPIMFRGGWNTGFRVPTFNQIFNGVTLSPYAGSDLVDPERCPAGTFNPAVPGCEFIRPEIATGGFLELGPETSEQATAGVVIQPHRNFSLSVDWWMINVDNTISLLTLRQLIENYDLFSDRFIRDASGTIIGIDQRWINAGARRTQGLEVSARGAFEAAGGTVNLGIDGTYLLKRREALTQDSPFGPSLIGVFTFNGDLGIRWKHNAFIGWSGDDVNVTLTQIFREGYRNYALPGIANGTVTRPDYNERVDDYVTYNLAVAYTGLENIRLSFGVKNLFDTDPPFAVTYDGNTGAGGSWEPRVADPRGRAFTFLAEVNF